MKLSLDHVPFVGNSAEMLESEFHALGFQCSPRGQYTSPEFPNQIWRTVCVFLEHGWLDLLESTQAPGQAMASGCLFLTDDLPDTLQKIGGISPSSSYSLDRRWLKQEGAQEGVHEDIGEHFELATFKEKICRLPVSIIQHHWPCKDIKASWVQHPNTALGLEAVFCSGTTVRPTSPLNQVLNNTQAQVLVPDEFAKRYGHDAPAITVQVRVQNLPALLAHLRACCVPHRQDGTGVLAYPPNIACVFEFVV